jgi:subtilisin-like proprotein convertase family protein
MKSLLIAVSLLAAAGADAAVNVSQSFSPDLTIPEANEAGVVDSESFTAAPAGGTVSGLTLSLTTTGGYNGDLYAYLISPNGTRVTLMDLPGTGVDGFGAESSGMNLTLDDSAATSIQNVTGGSGTTLTGTYQPADSLGAIAGSPANGTWDLYFADLGSDGGSPVLEDWTLNLEVVPEPVNTALGIFGGLLLFTAGRGRLWKLNKSL